MTLAIRVYNYQNLTGAQDGINLNWMQNPFTVTAAVDFVTGKAQYGIDYSVDQIDNVKLGDFRWFPWIAPGQTVSGVYSLTMPVTAIRLNLNSNTGLTRFTVIQAPNSTR